MLLDLDRPGSKLIWYFLSIELDMSQGLGLRLSINQCYVADD